jgi:hypothetical protein
MSDNEDFREDLITLLVNGMRIDWMQIKDVLEVVDFCTELTEYYMKDERLSHLFFWTQENVILHEEKTIESNFAVVVNGESIQFRTSNGTIDNHKNAGRILMSTVAFIHNKLEEHGLVKQPKQDQQIINKYMEKDQDTEEEPSEEDSSSDFEWL